MGLTQGKCLDSCWQASPPWATTPLKFQWDQVPLTGAPASPKWKRFYPEDNRLLVAAFNSKEKVVKLPRGFTVHLPTQAQPQEAAKPYADTPPAQFGRQIHDRKVCKSRSPWRFNLSCVCCAC